MGPKPAEGVIQEHLFLNAHIQVGFSEMVAGRAVAGTQILENLLNLGVF